MSEALKILQEFRENKRYSYMYDRIDTVIIELLAQPETKQEPVAWIIETQKIDGAFDKWVSMDKKHHRDFCDRGEPIPLYTSPPKREPLSDDEIGKLCKDHFKVANLTSFVRAIEKAHGITGVDDE